MKRPAGIIVSAILLGLLVLGQLLFVALFGLGLLLLGHQTKEMTSRQPAPLPPHAATFLFASMAVFFGLLAVWGIATLVGIVKLRRWGRISILIIGGALAVFCGLAMLGSGFALAMQGSLATTVPGNEAATRIAIGITLVFYGALAGLGVGWLVYFNKSSVRLLFQSDRRQSLAFPDQDQVLERPNDRRRPLSITILGWLYLFCGIMGLLVAAFAPPAFFAGIILSGWQASLLYLAIALLMGASGYGLLQRRKAGWVTAIALMLLGVTNNLLLLTPGVQAHFNVYVLQLQSRMTARMGFICMESNCVGPTALYSHAMLAPTIVLSLVLNGVMLFFLLKNRSYFTSHFGDGSRR